MVTFLKERNPISSERAKNSFRLSHRNGRYRITRTIFSRTVFSHRMEAIARTHTYTNTYMKHPTIRSECGSIWIGMLWRECVRVVVALLCACYYIRFHCLLLLQRFSRSTHKHTHTTIFIHVFIFIFKFICLRKYTTHLSMAVRVREGAFRTGK